MVGATRFLTPLLSAAQTSPLLLTTDADIFSLPACFQTSYHGTYGSQHVFRPSDEDCINSGLQSGLFSNGAFVPIFGHHDDSNYHVWVGPAGVEGWTGGSSALMEAWASIQAAAAASLYDSDDDDPSSKQKTFVSAPEVSIDDIPQLMYTANDGLFISVSPRTLPVLDTLLPRELVAVGISPSPLGWGIDEHYAENLANITKHLEHDKTLQRAVDTLNASSVRETVRWLTGEAPKSPITSRHSFTPGALDAAAWLKREMEKTGASCEYFTYLEHFAPNVICKYAARTNSTSNVILSGHYDSRGSFGNIRAPGADDDGSGTAHVLAVARAIHDNGITFTHPLTLALFSGEEQGLFGSHYYARHLKSQNASVALHIQADMLAYRVEGEPMQLALPEKIELPEAGWLVANVSGLYAPELVVGRTSACCSDHQSFLSYGYPATQVFERNDWIADPMYHNSGDLSDRKGYNFDQIVSIAKVTMASICEVAGWHAKK